MDDKGLLAAIKDFQNRTGGFGADDDYTAIKGAIAAYLAALSTEPEKTEGPEPVAWLVTWKRDGEEWVNAHANEVTAIEEARRWKGECTPLIPAAPTSEGSHHGS